MRTAIVKAYALGMITGSFLTAGIMLAAPAKADPTTDPYTYTYGPAVCATIDQTADQYPNDIIMLGIGQAVIEDGYTPFEAGEIIYDSINTFCPRHLGRALAFAGGVTA